MASWPVGRPVAAAGHVPLPTLLTAVGMASAFAGLLVGMQRGFAGQEMDHPPGGGCGEIGLFTGRAMVHGGRPVKARSAPGLAVVNGAACSLPRKRGSPAQP